MVEKALKKYIYKYKNSLAQSCRLGFLAQFKANVGLVMQAWTKTKEIAQSL